MFKLIIDGIEMAICEGEAGRVTPLLLGTATRNSKDKSSEGIGFTTTTGGSIFISSKQIANSVILAEPLTKVDLR